jgi:hypothetical protein
MPKKSREDEGVDDKRAKKQTIKKGGAGNTISRQTDATGDGRVSIRYPTSWVPDFLPWIWLGFVSPPRAIA